MRRVGWLQAMLRDETNHAQPLAAIFDDSWGKFLRRRMGCVRERSRLRWPCIETCTCPKESQVQRSYTRLFGGLGFSRSSWHSRKRGRFFLRIDTSLLRAACWTIASGVRLANHVKFQCGEVRKFDWCCEILSGLEPLVDPVFSRKEP